VDRYAGLIQFPAFVLALAGCWWWMRTAAGRAGRWMQLAAVPYLVILLFYGSWPGGTGTPGRMFVMIVPALALGLAALDRGLGDERARRWLDIAVWSGVAHALFVIFLPPLAFASAKERIESAAVARLGFDPLAVFPDIGHQPAGTFPGWPAVAGLILLMLACAALLRRLSRPSARRR
jgi:hypothetical protein